MFQKHYNGKYQSSTKKDLTAIKIYRKEYYLSIEKTSEQLIYF